VHEWALAEGVISTALKIAQEKSISEITRIKVKMGELQQIDTEIFELALKGINQLQSAIIARAQIEFETEEAVLKCRICGQEWAFNDSLKKLAEDERESIHFVPEIAHVYITCPSCKSHDFEFVKGRGVWLDSIEGE
jgi:hydrogenase nickel incorporation protein HypA/HybF